MAFIALVLAAAVPVVAPDVHSLANPQDARPTHLSLDLDLRFPQKTIAGVAELTLSYPRPGAPRHLDLDTRDLKVRAVTEPRTGRPLPFALEAPVAHLGQRLRITLPRPLPRRVRIAYEIFLERHRAGSS